ncbi:hypothetical protein CFP66_42365 [Pseudonocardia sp. MH-G8]|nr:hypothetical protein CFP66_42365 [Pseudonocardia sp. MH-G8]
MVTLVGVGGSKLEYLDDPQVRAQLLRRHVTVQTTRLGSREAARADFEGVDFVFPSGQPTAELVQQRRQQAQEYASAHRVFVSPIVLATYREYAETLRAAGLARPQPGQDPGRPIYYDLSLGPFLDQGRAGRTWDDLGIGRQGVSNGNTVLAQTSNVCAANSAATYLGLVAFMTRGGVPDSEEDGVELARQIRPLLREQGLPTRAPDVLYFIPEGRGLVPVIVIYEHQYLAYQLGRVDAGAGLDEDRVLLYPDATFQNEPTLVALTAEAQWLGDYLTTDPELRRRALELGYRVLDPSLDDSSAELPGFLAERGVPAPSMSDQYTRALLPDVPTLEAMITAVGDCPPIPG